MVFEDAHWIDPSSRELLDLIFDRVPGLDVLLVVPFRPESRHAWSGPPHVSMLALNRLGEGDGAALVEHLAGNAGLSHEIVEEIVERADGVPLFVEELTKAVLESADRDNRVAAVLGASPLPNLAIPATLQHCNTARLADCAPRSARPGHQGDCANWRRDRPRILLRADPAGGTAPGTRPRNSARPPDQCRASVLPRRAAALLLLVQACASARYRLCDFVARPPAAAACRHCCSPRTGTSRDCRSPARAARSSLHRGRPETAGH